MPRQINIAGLPVHAINLGASVELLRSWIVQRRRHYVCLCNVHSVVCCLGNEFLRRIYCQAGLRAPDGMPLVLLMKRRGLADVGRVYGPDLMLALSNRLLGDGCRHFFFGAAPGIAERLVERLKARYQGFQTAGVWSPPFHPVTATEDKDAIDRINDSGADVVWVGLGAPKQEIWMAEHRPALCAPLLLGVGYAFDALSGAKPQAPDWMQHACLEWAFRFGCEPRRLWPRIFIDGPCFMAALISQTLKVKNFNR